MDPCGFITDDREVIERTFVVRRGWSARAAAGGHDPCVPAVADRPYVAFVPEQPAVRLLNSGDTATITLAAAADRPIGKCTVTAVDLTGSQQHERYVDVVLDQSTVTSGESGTLRVTLRKLPPHGLSIVGIVSTLDGDSHLRPLAVVTR